MKTFWHCFHIDMEKTFTFETRPIRAGASVFEDLIHICESPILGNVRYTTASVPYVFWYRRIRNPFSPLSSRRVAGVSLSSIFFCVPQGAYVCTYVRSDLHLSPRRKRRKSAFHEHKRWARILQLSREWRWGISWRVLVDLRSPFTGTSPDRSSASSSSSFAFPSSHVCSPFRIYIGAVERLRPQVRLYITEHVPARDMLHAVKTPDFGETSKRCAQRERERVRRLVDSGEKERKRERDVYACRPFSKRHISRLFEKE